MTALSFAIVLFLILEAANVVTLYFFPGSRLANGVGVFQAWERSKADPELHAFVRYLVNWVAGTKLIFLALLVVILATGGVQTQLFTAVAMLWSILSFFWRLFPAIKALDSQGKISPPGYSRTLGFMITGFLGIFAVALGVHLFAGA